MIFPRFTAFHRCFTAFHRRFARFRSLKTVWGVAPHVIRSREAQKSGVCQFPAGSRPCAPLSRTGSLKTGFSLRFTVFHGVSQLFHRRFTGFRSLKTVWGVAPQVIRSRGGRSSVVCQFPACSRPCAPLSRARSRGNKVFALFAPVWRVSQSFTGFHSCESSLAASSKKLANPKSSGPDFSKPHANSASEYTCGMS